MLYRRRGACRQPIRKIVRPVTSRESPGGRHDGCGALTPDAGCASDRCDSLPPPWLSAPVALRAMRRGPASSIRRPNCQSQSQATYCTSTAASGWYRSMARWCGGRDVIERVLFGATDTDELIGAVEEAGRRDDVQALFLDIDSPGGAVNGTPELAAAVAEVSRRKYVYAFTRGRCSARHTGRRARPTRSTRPQREVGSIALSACTSTIRSGSRRRE